MRGLAAAMGAWLVGCGQAEAPPPPVAATVPVAQAPVAPPPPTVHRETRTIASFTNGELWECDDFAFEGSLADAPAVTAAAAGLTAELENGSTVLLQTCDEAFGDRTVWGTCSIRDERQDPRLVVTGAARFYRFADVYDSDGRMQECLEMRGAWSAKPRDTPEWTRARREADLAALQRRADEASARADEALRTLSGRRR
jgi:hypothetical protein